MTPKKEVKEPNLEAGDTLFNMLDYFCSKINMAKSPLDSTAIGCLNTLFIELRKDTRIIK